LLDRGAPIDGFGVGTRMGTMADQPYLDSAYKLSGYDGEPRMKLATDKSNLPGRKQVIRRFEQGRATEDVICTAEEAASMEGTSLLDMVMKDGRRTEAGRTRSLDDIRDDGARQLTALPDRIQQIEPTETPYPVHLSPALEQRRDRVRASLRGKMNIST